ncbi:MAG: hypothetical protein JW888_09355 [Pirellulales bacterium]|nr:hypothetical protein [Pirellulales bacterium]
MTIHRLLITMLIVSCAGSWAWGKEEVRYYAKDGVTFRETRRVVQRPILETHTQQATQTVYREESVTELRDTTRERWTPVTEYRWEAVWVGRWNPLTQPYLAYRYVPRTHWECATETVKAPVVCRRLVPETRVVSVPVTTQRVVEEEVINRVAVGSVAAPKVPWTQPTNVAKLVPVPSNSEPIGSVARLENDPPRHGVSTAWRASDSTRR